MMSLSNKGLNDASHMGLRIGMFQGMGGMLLIRPSEDLCLFRTPYVNIAATGNLIGATGPCCNSACPLRSPQ